MNLHKFAAWAASLPKSDETRYLECAGTETCWPYSFLRECGHGGLVWFERSPFVAAVYPDGSAQLLSRDEDECVLFSTLWELEK